MECIGGLRSPWRAVRKLPELAAAGRVVREVLEQEVDNDPSLLDIVSLLGKEVGEGSVDRRWLEEQGERLGKVLVDRLGGKWESREQSSRVSTLWRIPLVEAFGKAARDPEKHLAGWLREGCPAGIAREIPGCGIFPESRCRRRAWSRRAGREAKRAGAGGKLQIGR